MKNFKIIAFTHKNSSLDELGRFHLDVSAQQAKLSLLKDKMSLKELMFISTCNRVEFLVVNETPLDTQFLTQFFSVFNPAWDAKTISWAVTNAAIYNGDKALLHLFNVASSIDSLVVGEREIITQVRDSYNRCAAFGITGDLIRLVIKKTVETAKHVYTHTNISRNPVSVVSLAYRKLKELNVNLDASFIVIGAGQTNANMVKYLKKHGFKNFTVFNRTLVNAQNLAKEINAEAYSLNDLKSYTKGFDVILTCTGSTDYIITKDIYTQLLQGDESKKIIIDLAVPNDLDPEVLTSHNINLIAVSNLQEIAEENLLKRQGELEACNIIIRESIAEFHKILKERRVELAMSDVPKAVKQIKEIALNEIFAKEISTMDVQSKEVLEKVLTYMEKKYISGPMIMAKEILIKE